LHRICVLQKYNGVFAMKEKLTLAAVLLCAFLLLPLTASAEDVINPANNYIQIRSDMI
jgi:hypothetical protein